MKLYLLVLVLTLDGVLSSCPSPFEKIENQCLLLNHEREMTWTEAEWFCRWNNAELILLKDEESQNQIVNLLSLRGIKRNFWIGGFVNPDSTWNWIDQVSIQSNDTRSASNE